MSIHSKLVPITLYWYTKRQNASFSIKVLSTTDGKVLETISYPLDSEKMLT